ncbi:AAA family ATPase [Sphingosinicella sp. BN140058]|uniref:AAA family ATPase n=1 Tax=Sphingosinicella sp. BN140058 TaxID=1892855 RepID=UPI001011298E|nr:AAA family ATPase [Sphingosinicella sp. BN140058]QAY78566.1 AAA family ATPase [Sphingosinicella sp. BN140058]
MGEKLLAQRILCLLRATKSRGGKAAAATLDWAADQRDWLWPDRVWRDPKKKKDKSDSLDWDSLPRLADEIVGDEEEDLLAAAVAAVADLLDLDGFDRALLGVATALDRLPHVAVLRDRLACAGEDVPALAALLAGAEPAGAALRVRRSPLVKLGLIETSADSYSGGVDLTLDWRLADILDDGCRDEERLIAVLAGARQPATLIPDDFAEHANDLDFLVRLLRGAVAQGASGVNVLIHGPPGTGKTEFARTLAAAAGLGLHAVGESDSDGDEPNRRYRVHALTRAQRLLARRGRSLILFDEMEDLFADGVASSQKLGSKVFVNRLLETNLVPILWTSNAICEVDPAHLRRMSYVLRMDYPGPRARARIVTRIAATEGVRAESLDTLVAREPETAAIARVALRSAALAGGDGADVVARSLLLGLRGGRCLPPSVSGDAPDLDLYEADQGIRALVAQLSSADAPSDFSLLLTGPPGTGKTALAAHIAERLDRPLAVKRGSDLLSKWVGGTEANIADAFAAAREDGSVLLFDEVDSLLRDRQDAHQSWEVTQVNELLTWLDSHPLPFIAATNFAQRLDPAALRRFVFKIDLKPMSRAAAERAFCRFFGLAAPSVLCDIGGLTPGDFAVVKRQLRYRPGASATEIATLLRAEARAKPERPVRIGF